MKDEGQKCPENVLDTRPSVLGLICAFLLRFLFDSQRVVSRFPQIQLLILRAMNEEWCILSSDLHCTEII